MHTIQFIQLTPKHNKCVFHIPYTPSHSESLDGEERKWVSHCDVPRSHKAEAFQLTGQG